MKDDIAVDDGDDGAGITSRLECGTMLTAPALLEALGEAGAEELVKTLLLSEVERRRMVGVELAELVMSAKMKEVSGGVNSR